MYTVTVNVEESDNSAVANADVSVAPTGTSVTADDAGTAIVKLPAGNYDIEATDGSTIGSETITVSADASQTITLGMESATGDSAGPDDDTGYTISTISSESGGDNGDRYRITLNHTALNNNGFNIAAFSAGDDAELTITTASGAQKTTWRSPRPNASRSSTA